MSQKRLKVPLVETGKQFRMANQYKRQIATRAAVFRLRPLQRANQLPPSALIEIGLPSVLLRQPADLAQDESRVV